MQKFAPYGFAIAGGALVPLAFAPTSRFFTIILSLALLARALNGTTVRQGAIIGYCYGTASFLFGVFWITNSLTQYGDLSSLVAALSLAGIAAFIGLWYAFFGALWRAIARKEIAWRTVWFAATFTFCEWLRVWIDPGLPWLMVGTTALDTSYANLLPIGGIYLATFAIVATGYAVEKASRFREDAPRASQAFVLAGALWLLCGALPPNEISESKTKTSIRLVQPNLNIDTKWARGGFEYSWRQNIRETANFTGDLVVWPETSLPGTMKHEVVQNKVASIRNADFKLITGLLATSDLGFYNSVYLFGEDASQDQRIDKRKLLPFGEYLPLEPVTRVLFQFLNIPGPKLVSAAMEQKLLQFKDNRIAALICLEIAYPQIARDATQDANILITVANDTWFGRTAGPHQHFEIARVRALELGIWVLRVGNDGRTAVINPHGEVVDWLTQFRSGHLDVEIAPERQPTQWNRFGNAIVTLVVLFCLLASFFASRGRRWIKEIENLSKEVKSPG